MPNTSLPENWPEVPSVRAYTSHMEAIYHWLKHGGWHDQHSFDKMADEWGETPAANRAQYYEPQSIMLKPEKRQALLQVLQALQMANVVQARKTAKDTIEYRLRSAYK